MRLAVAVSGGADSLLSLGLLRAEGHDVVAVHAHFLPPDMKGQELARAIETQCGRLGVPFAAVDLSREFGRQVVAPFIAAYAAGQTPNPCAACNRDMKFGLLMEAARELGADKLATGHFARLQETDRGPALFRGADDSRDQSYFLSLVPRDALARAVFPLARRRKADHPAALAALGLAPPLPKESREVCFVPGDDYRAFLEASGAALTGPGPIVLTDGTRLGTHQGLWRHTIGQRKGLGIAYADPLYVLGKDTAANTLVVGVRADLDATACRTGPANLLADPAGWPATATVLAQTCYRMRPRPARAVLGPDGGLALTFDAPVARPTPGQVATVYDAAGRVLAGGVLVPDTLPSPPDRT
ncbi:tRNA (5-methylaminomethyl-2-thiouridylate)-methyltransferase [Solidesulfovibrio carbinoliphilus subsp. oakridgensis]|uniref:tRNA-specific 2-thiouridylase MnmA n=1 Tax=Solidesulfovibrio carbinoliphilus subsp. oakridgensis TaxID=694327 RepID=G7QBR0_9BACT|nr:tRNA-specific 2-thiouridylase [Solidesulfovibrio carbinoliphilus]EHJ49403.1 tRNA (5-methylaminomethyl-2-thiouridylate)-methyltransferase [Solidesulfovibrio carbinoliphilus subsp. oakridgensis]